MSVGRPTPSPVGYRFGPFRFDGTLRRLYRHDEPIALTPKAAETLLAAKDGDKLHIVRETADLWFHTLVMLSFHGLGPEDVVAELHRREGISGVDEKAARRR